MGNQANREMPQEELRGYRRSHESLETSVSMYDFLFMAHAPISCAAFEQYSNRYVESRNSHAAWRRVAFCSSASPSSGHNVRAVRDGIVIDIKTRLVAVGWPLTPVGPTRIMARSGLRTLQRLQRRLRYLACSSTAQDLGASRRNYAVVGGDATAGQGPSAVSQNRMDDSVEAALANSSSGHRTAISTPPLALAHATPISPTNS